MFFVQEEDPLVATMAGRKLPTWFLKVPVCCVPGVPGLGQAGLHGPQLHLGAVALRVLGGAAAPAVAVLAHKLALLIAAHVAEGGLHEPGLEILRQDGLQTCSTSRAETCEDPSDRQPRVKTLVIAQKHPRRICPPASVPFSHLTYARRRAPYAGIHLWFYFYSTVQLLFVANHYCSRFTLQVGECTRGGAVGGETAKEWLKLNSLWHSHAAVISSPEEQTQWQFHQKLGREFNYGWPNLANESCFRGSEPKRSWRNRGCHSYCIREGPSLFRSPRGRQNRRGTFNLYSGGNQVMTWNIHSGS